MKRLLLPFLTLLALVAAFSPSANAQFIINPTFSSSITSDPNAAEIEAGIESAISRIEGDIANTSTVNITFAEMGSGLGESSTLHFVIPYTTYISALTGHATSADDATALASLPPGPNNPVNGNADINVNTALARVLGIANNPGSDGTISLNTSIMNLSRTGTQNPSDYDLQAVVAHEVDEVLGVGGPGTSLPTTNSSVGVLDLYRYGAPGVRSFATPANTTAYFSINGGVTDLVHFNQVSGGDYADWGNGNLTGQEIGNNPPQVQDAFGDPGVDVNVGQNELIALDIVGYHLTPQGTLMEEGLTATPEPSTWALLLGGLALLGFHVRRKRASVKA